MPLPRDYASALFGANGLGHGQPTMPAYGELKRVSARDIACPSAECSAQEGEDCTTGRMSTGRHPQPLLCPDRLELCRILRDEGKLAVKVVEPPSRCRKCSTFSGRSVACSEHSCQRSNCNVLAEPGTSWCADHRDTGNGRQKMTPGKVQELHRLHAQGKTHQEIADQLNVSKQTIFNYVKRSREQADNTE
jgi:hypothetical protein